MSVGAKNQLIIEMFEKILKFRYKNPNGKVIFYPFSVPSSRSFVILYTLQHSKIWGSSFCGLEGEVIVVYCIVISRRLQHAIWVKNEKKTSISAANKKYEKVKISELGKQCVDSETMSMKSDNAHEPLWQRPKKPFADLPRDNLRTGSSDCCF